MDLSLDSIGPFLLLFSIAGGYAFSRKCHITKFLADGLQWEKNLFQDAIYGGYFFLLIRLAILPQLETRWPGVLTSWAQHHTKLPIPYLGSFALSLACAYLVAIAINYFFSPEWAIRNAVQKNGNELTQLLHSAGANGYPVSLTMTNRKVYVGFVMAPPTLNFPYIRILPTLSGHRHEVDLKITFDTDYISVYDSLEKKRAKGHDVIDDEDFGIVLPMGEICSANFFDNETYLKHFQEKPKK